jgi:putative hydrolase of the HAD superfamily
MIRAVIFDLDDTLYLERDYVQSGFRAVAEWLCARLPEPGQGAGGVAQVISRLEQEQRSNPGHAFDALANDLADTNDPYRREHRESGKDTENPLCSPDSLCELSGRPEGRAAVVAGMREVYRGHSPNIRPCPDVVPALRCLMEDYRLAILSDGAPERQERKLAALGIGRFFSHRIFAAPGSNRCKPSAVGFQELAEALGQRPQACVYVADNPAKDFGGPREIGMHTVRVRRALGLHAAAEPAPGFEPEQTLEDLTQLPQELGRLGSCPTHLCPGSLPELERRVKPPTMRKGAVLRVAYPRLKTLEAGGRA